MPINTGTVLKSPYKLIRPVTTTTSKTIYIVLVIPRMIGQFVLIDLHLTAIQLEYGITWFE